MRILGIDYGDVRIGVAISDPMGWTAQMLETVHWRFDVTKPLTRLAELISQYGVELVLVGLPRNMDGSEGFRVEKTMEFIRHLEAFIPAVLVKTWDERLTTVMAQRALHDMGVKAKDQKGKVDQVAAAIILQSYLDSGLAKVKAKNNLEGE